MLSLMWSCQRLSQPTSASLQISHFKEDQKCDPQREVGETSRHGSGENCPGQRTGAPSPLSPSKLLTAFPCWCVWGRGWVVIHCHVGNLPDLQTSFPVALITVFHVGLRNTQGQGFP